MLLPASGRLTALAGQPAGLVVDEPEDPLPEGVSWLDESVVIPVVAGADRPALEIRSPSAILMEPLSGEVLFEKDSTARTAPASLTKLMTLLLAFEAIRDGRLSLTEKLVASAHVMRLGGTTAFLETGEEMTIDHIVLSVAVASANDASLALAEHMSGSEEEFVKLMNQRAEELGMTNTHFANCHGLDAENHYSCARDMAILSCEITKHPKLLEYTSIFETRIREGKTWLVNRNHMLNYYQGCDGLKTGWTVEAGYSVAITAARQGTRYVAVVMKAATPNDRFADCAKMLSWGFANYSSLLVAEKGQSYGAVPVNLGRCQTVPAVAPADRGVLVRKGTEGEVSRQVVLETLVQAPVHRGDEVGAIVVTLGGEEVGRCPLVADRDSERITFLGLWWRLYKRVLGAAG